MATIVVNPQQAEEEITTELNRLQIIVEEEDWFGLFDRMQVFRSVAGPDGPFEELTAADWKPARLPKSGGDQPASAVTGANVNIVGDDIDFIVNRDVDLTVSFTGSNPITIANAASQITSKSFGMLSAYVDEDGNLVVETTSVGSSSSLEVIGGDAAPELKLPTTQPDSLAYGKDPRVALVQGIGTYEFIDQFGSRDYWYKTRYINKSTGATSDFSFSFSSNSGVEVSASSLIVGVAELVGVDGKPMRNAEVRVYSDFNGTLVEGKLLAAQSLIKLTDKRGRVEFKLLRGQKITASIAGTPLVRTFIVPTDTALSTFNLFDPTIADDDVFVVNVPVLVSAEKRTL
jgi:hypothetical protein